MDSRAAAGVEAGLSRPRAAAGPNRCRVGRDGRHARAGREVHYPPCWHDGTERPIHRPTDPEAQPESYSGKKKGHTRTNLLVSNETGHMGFLSHTCAGKASEKSLAELAGYTLPPGRCL
jgi:hypothetical protein